MSIGNFFRKTFALAVSCSRARICGLASFNRGGGYAGRARRVWPYEGLRAGVGRAPALKVTKRLQFGYKTVTNSYNSVTKNRQNAQFWEKIFFNFCARFYLTFLRLCGIMEISGRCVRSRPAIIPQPKAFVNRQKCTKKQRNHRIFWWFRWNSRLFRLSFLN